MDKLDFKWGLRKGEMGKSKRDYIDFTVNGKPLSELLNISEYDFVGYFGWGSSPGDYEIQLINQLKGIEDSTLDTKRFMLYGCPECADIGCGSITIDLEFQNNKVTWKNFAYENSIEVDKSGFENIGQFEFDSTDYDVVFKKLELTITHKV